MINNAPAKFQVSTFVPAYTKALISHNVPSDFDIAGLAMYSKVGASAETYSLIGLSTGRTYFVIENIAANTVAEFAFYDDLANNPSLLASGFGLNRSDPLPLVMLSPPVIDSVTVTSETVDVGTIPGEFTVNMLGDATHVIIQIKESNASTWITKYSGSYVSSINLGTIGDGTYSVRCMGTYTLLDGTTESDTQWRVYSTTVDTVSASASPDAPTNISYIAMKKTTPAETYDVKVSWDWDKGNGGGLRAFRIQWRPVGTTIYQEETNIGKTLVLPDIPYNILHDIVIESISFGSGAVNKLSSTFLVHESVGSRVPAGMSFSDFTQDTDIQIGYRYIRAYQGTGASRALTFKIDAEDGSMSIGKASSEYGNLAPITIDGATGTMAINGRIITDKIYAATYEMSWINASDTPQFRTANKTSYGAAGDGIWMGYSSNNNFQFALGNANSYLKFDSGTGKILISANVEIKGSGTLGSYYETRYKNSVAAPTKPTIRNPTDWFINAPTAVNGQALYQTTARINAEETLNTTWSTPVLAVLGGDGASAYELWQDAGNTGTEQDFLNSLIGSPGTSGTSGAGFFRYGVAGFTVWSTAHANNAMLSLRGATNAAITGDVLTLYNSSDVTVAETRSYNGSSWVAAALLVHGDMIATGTIITEKLVADNASFSSAGIDVIYNQGGNSSSYTMKIDLVSGSIHIK